MRALGYIKSIVLTAIVAIAGSCSVHEWPHLDYGEVEFILDLDYEMSMPLYKEITYTRGANISREQPDNCDIRYIVEVYPSGESRTASRDAARNYIFTRSYDGVLDTSVSIDLEEGSWDIYVWTDYVDRNSTSDKYYRTADFAAITYLDKDGYVGSDDCREAFKGMTTVTVTHPNRYLEGEPLPSYRATVEMGRPMGRYEFISTDVDAFLQRMETTLARSVDLSEFRVVFRYNAFMPSTYNIFTDKPSDSWTGMSFTSPMALGDDGMLMGFDYVLVNGDETVMNINVEVYDSNGTLLSATRGVEVPVMRNRLTIVKGAFLTSAASGGVAINPGFDGDDYNIEIY